MNKKGAIKMSIGTIIVIVLTITILILGMVLVKSFFEKPEFKITEEKCWNETFTNFGWDAELFQKIENIEYYYRKIGCNYIIELNLSVPDICLQYNKLINELENLILPPQNKTKEVCEDIEVEKWYFLCDNYYRNNCTLIDTENPFKNILGRCTGNNVICKEDLTIEWLDENCEGISESFYQTNCNKRNKFPKTMCEGHFGEYKCGDYKVEVIK